MVKKNNKLVNLRIDLVDFSTLKQQYKVSSPIRMRMIIPRVNPAWKRNTLYQLALAYLEWPKLQNIGLSITHNSSYGIHTAYPALTIENKCGIIWNTCLIPHGMLNIDVPIIVFHMAKLQGKDILKFSPKDYTSFRALIFSILKHNLLKINHILELELSLLFVKHVIRM